MEGLADGWLPPDPYIKLKDWVDERHKHPDVPWEMWERLDGLRMMDMYAWEIDKRLREKPMLVWELKPIPPSQMTAEQHAAVQLFNSLMCRKP